MLHSSAPRHAHAADAFHHARLRGFLAISPRTLAVAAGALSIAFLGVQNAPASAAPIETEPVATQSITVPADVAIDTGDRDVIGVSTYSAVQWPISPRSPLGDRFGPRVPPCAACSSYHRGVDFDPGYGTPIHAIANGVVIEVGNPSGDLGVHVIIQHRIGHETVSSVYGHMILGSMSLHVGQRITIGQVIGRVGSTGESTGPHLHFGIQHGDVATDPLAWLRAHVTETFGSLIAPGPTASAGLGSGANTGVR